MKKNKIRVVCASRPLEAGEAKEFAKRFESNFEGKYLFSGKYVVNRKKTRIPLYCVVWIPPDGLPLISGHEIRVQRERCLPDIPKVRQIHLGEW